MRSAKRNGIATTATIATPVGVYHHPRPASARVAVSIAIHTSTAASHATRRKQRVAVVNTPEERSRWSA